MAVWMWQRLKPTPYAPLNRIYFNYYHVSPLMSKETHEGIQSSIPTQCEGFPFDTIWGLAFTKENISF